MEQQNEMEDPKEYEEDGVEDGGGGEGEGREWRGGGMFSQCSLIRFPNRFTPSLIKKRKRRVKGVCIIQFLYSLFVHILFVIFNLAFILYYFVYI